MAQRNRQLMSALGKAVREVRQHRGLSQEALADRAELDRSYMSQIERGVKNCTISSLARISDALAVNPSDLLQTAQAIMLRS